jgi:DNA polymerase-3 subunit alpha
VAYEEHILQICEAFAGLSGGRADVLRRSLVKENWPVVEQIGQEFVAGARARGHSEEDILTVWQRVAAFRQVLVIPIASCNKTVASPGERC